MEKYRLTATRWAATLRSRLVVVAGALPAIKGGFAHLTQVVIIDLLACRKDDKYEQHKIL